MGLDMSINLSSFSYPIVLLERCDIGPNKIHYKENVVDCKQIFIKVENSSETVIKEENYCKTVDVRSATKKHKSRNKRITSRLGIRDLRTAKKSNHKKAQKSKGKHKTVKRECLYIVMNFKKYFFL